MSEQKTNDYETLERLILEKEDLLREAEQLRLGYLKEFGDYVAETYQAKMECIRIKKMIAYCDAFKEKGKPINKAELEVYVENDMKSFEKAYSDLIEDIADIRNTPVMSGAKEYRFKRMFARLAKRIHPQLRPETLKNSVLNEYWNQITTAYRFNNYDILKELSRLVQTWLKEQPDAFHGEPVTAGAELIQGIEEEIQTITSNYPYLYRYILESEIERNGQIQEFESETENYRNYAKQLEQQLETYKIEDLYA